VGYNWVNSTLSTVGVQCVCSITFFSTSLKSNKLITYSASKTFNQENKIIVN